MTRIAITGATGTIGSALVDRARRDGIDVVALGRDPQQTREVLGDGIEAYRWSDPAAEPAPGAALAGTDAVVHLLGEPVAQRWTHAAKRRISESRELGTRNLVAAIESLPPPDRPGVLVSQSATGFYGPRGEEPVTELEGPGSDFLAEVTVAWEGAADQARQLGLRVAVTRTGVVLSARGGALEKMLPPFRLGVGGPVAGGRQYVPWIHLDDVVGGLLHSIRDARTEGAVNLTAPNPVTNAELSRALGRVLHRPAVLPVPGLAVRALFGEMASIVTTGARVVPARLQELGYTFAFSEVEPALRDVLGDEA